MVAGGFFPAGGRDLRAMAEFVMQLRQQRIGRLLRRGYAVERGAAPFSLAPYLKVNLSAGSFVSFLKITITVHGVPTVNQFTFDAASGTAAGVSAAVGTASLLLDRPTTRRAWAVRVAADGAAPCAGRNKVILRPFSAAGADTDAVVARWLFGCPEFFPMGDWCREARLLLEACASIKQSLMQIGLTIIVPLYFEVVHKLTATESGIALIPIALTTPGSLLSGQAMLYWKHYKRAPIIGMTLALAALTFLVWRPDMPLTYVIAILSVVGTAIGLVFPVTTVSIQNAVRRTNSFLRWVMLPDTSII